MKNLTLLLLIISLLTGSCVMTKTYTAEQKKMITGDEVFVVTKKGEKVSGKKIEWPSAFNVHSTWVKIDGRQMDSEDLMEYQDKKGHYVLFGTERNRRTYVTQIKRGKINLYYYDVSGQNGTDTYFVFQKNNGKLIQANIEEIVDMLKDNKEALNKFTSQFGTENKKFLPKQLDKHPKVLFQSIDIYNGNI